MVPGRFRVVPVGSGRFRVGSAFTYTHPRVNEDTLLRTHCCRHKCFPVCPRAQHLLRTQILCPGHQNVSDFVQKHFVSATNVSQFARSRKRHEQQCFRNNVSSFATAFITNWRDTQRCAVQWLFSEIYVFL